MIKFYCSGKEFLAENKEILEEYPLETVFFEVNAKAIEHANLNDFLVRLQVGGKYLIAVHNSHYPMVISGDSSLCAELAREVYGRKLTFDKILGCLDTCEAFLAEYGKFVVCTHEINHAMDIMRCDRVLTDNVDGVERPSDNDIDELARLIADFTAEALGDSADVEKVKKYVAERLKMFVVIRCCGKIVSLASLKRETDKLACIADVYTLPSYRLKGLSCKAVTYLTKEIIASGRLAYLFVDKNNPVSNHLYTKIGYTYAVPQFEIKITR